MGGTSVFPGGGGKPNSSAGESDASERNVGEHIREHFETLDNQARSAPISSPPTSPSVFLSEATGTSSVYVEPNAGNTPKFEIGFSQGFGLGYGAGLAAVVMPQASISQGTGSNSVSASAFVGGVGVGIVLPFSTPSVTFNWNNYAGQQINLAAECTPSAVLVTPIGSVQVTATSWTGQGSSVQVSLGLAAAVGLFGGVNCAVGGFAVDTIGPP